MIVRVSVPFYGKLDIGLTSVLLRSVGVSQSEQEVLHIAPSLLMWVGVLLHTFGNFYPRSSRTTHSVTAWNLIGKQRDAPGKFSQTKTTNPKSWKLCRPFFIRNKCWFFFSVYTLIKTILCNYSMTKWISFSLLFNCYSCTQNVSLRSARKYIAL